MGEYCAARKMFSMSRFLERSVPQGFVTKSTVYSVSAQSESPTYHGWTSFADEFLIMGSIMLYSYEVRNFLTGPRDSLYFMLISVATLTVGKYSTSVYISLRSFTET